jgi:site-specific recombinase XerD
MDENAQRATYQQLTKTINKYTKQIAFELGINKIVTTYFARHSFATVLKRSGESSDLIKELIGHGTVQTTEVYLDGFEWDDIRKRTAALTKGFSLTK